MVQGAFEVQGLTLDGQGWDVFVLRAFQLPSRKSARVASSCERSWDTVPCRMAGVITSARIDIRTKRGGSPVLPVKPHSHTMSRVSQAHSRCPSAHVAVLQHNSTPQTALFRKENQLACEMGRGRTCGLSLTCEGRSGRSP